MNWFLARAVGMSHPHGFPSALHCAPAVLFQQCGLELRAEPTAVALHEMGAELVLMRREHIEAARKLVIVDLLPRDAGQILHRAVRIPAFRGTQLRTLPANPSHPPGGSRERFLRQGATCGTWAGAKLQTWTGASR
jgi:hypothetical protein